MQYLATSVNPGRTRKGILNSPVINTSLSSFAVDVKVLQVVVEINTSGTKVSTEKSSVSGEDGSHVNVSLSTQGDSETSLPFVEMGDDGLLGLVFRKLSEEPGDEVSEYNGLVGLVVVLGSRDSGEVPQVGLPFVQSKDAELR
jgi:hypothetical protein